MERLFELVNGLPKEQKDIFYKYMGVLPAITKDFDEKLTFAKDNGVRLTSAAGLVRFFSMGYDELVYRFNKYKDNDLAMMICNKPELIRFDVDTVLERISICKKVDRPYLIDGKYADFLFNDTLWKVIEKNINSENDFEEIKEVKDLSSWTNPDMEEVVEKALTLDDQLEFDETTYNKYIKISEIIKRVKEAIGATSETKDNAIIPIATDDLIVKLMKVDPSLSEEQIAKYCLKYCEGLDAGVDEIIAELSTNMDKEKRGL